MWNAMFLKGEGYFGEAQKDRGRRQLRGRQSTLARELGRFLAIHVYSIDKIYWLPGWKLRDQTRFHLLHERWIDEDSWIIEGVGYWEEMEHRLSESDLSIFLDVPVDVCKQRAAIRMERERYEPNPDITLGCVYGSVKELQMEIIEHFHRELRPKLFEYLSRFSPEKVRVIASRSDLEF
jgi:adenylate kinase family enzyme